MLIHLQIRDFAIVECLELEFEQGMSAVTGETGAGKSIIVDALGFLLGDRADSTVVRHGAEQADISGVFDLNQLPEARAWLIAHELATAESTCHLRRVISAKGRSRAYIAGTLQPLQRLQEFSEHLVDIHGQHEHQSLLKKDLQRQLLDDYADNTTLVTELNGCHQHWRDLGRQLTALHRASAERNERLHLLRYQVQELEALALRAGELAELEEEHVRLANAGRLLESCQRALGWLYENDELSSQGLLSQASQEIEALSQVDTRLDPIHELLTNALIQIQEASDELRRYLNRLELDPSRLEWLEQRLDQIHSLARKHRVPPEELPILLERLRLELDTIENNELQQEHLERQLEETLACYHRCAETLSLRRRDAATALASKVSAAMQDLGMPGGSFEIALERQDKPGPQGAETIEFLVSANPGQPLRPLTKVASGGELSRISLAIHVIAARSARIPTLIFDEVDTGIGVNRQVGVEFDPRPIVAEVPVVG